MIEYALAVATLILMGVAELWILYLRLVAFWRTAVRRVGILQRVRTRVCVGC